MVLRTLLGGAVAIIGLMTGLWADPVFAQTTPPITVTPSQPTAPDIPTIFADGTGTESLGSVIATGIGFNYLNNFLLVQSLTERFRNIPLVTYHGDAADSSSATSGYPTGGVDSAPYGPGYAPAYDGQGYGGYPVYDQNGYPVSSQTAAGYSSVTRGQAEYGDPGTLIYSFWGGVLGGSGTVKNHSTVPGYDTEQYGGVVGLDLFCASDCRSGLFYAYQQGKIKKLSNTSAWKSEMKGDLTDPADLTNYTGEAYKTTYDYKMSDNALYRGSLTTDNHMVGLYHQFGDEFIYNIATLRGGYNRVKTTESLSGTSSADYTRNFYHTANYSTTATDPWGTATNTESGTINGTVNGSYNNKFNEYTGGIGFERGANFKLSPFTLTPRAGADYTYLYREKSNVLFNNSALNFKKGNYHSLRTILGGDVSLDMFPGSQQLKALLRGSWVHEYLDYLDGETDVTSPFYHHTLTGNTMGRDWALVGGGIDWTIVPALMIYANYDFMMNKYIDQHYGMAGLKIMW